MVTRPVDLPGKLWNPQDGVPSAAGGGALPGSEQSTSERRRRGPKASVGPCQHQRVHRQLFGFVVDDQFEPINEKHLQGRRQLASSECRLKAFASMSKAPIPV